MKKEERMRRLALEERERDMRQQTETNTQSHHRNQGSTAKHGLNL
jgi:hypothetical protein